MIKKNVNNIQLIWFSINYFWVKNLRSLSLSFSLLYDYSAQTYLILRNQSTGKSPYAKLLYRSKQVRTPFVLLC